MPEQNHAQLAELTTERLFLRGLKFTDAHEIAMLRSEKEANKYLNRPPTITIEEAKAYIDKIKKGVESNDWYYWALTLKNDPKLIGTICLWNIDRENGNIKIGYELSPALQGTGLMQEAVKKLIEINFRHLPYKKILAVPDQANSKSISLLEKMGFTRIENPGAEVNASDADIWFSLSAPGEG